MNSVDSLVFGCLPFQQRFPPFPPQPRSALSPTPLCNPQRCDDHAANLTHSLCAALHVGDVVGDVQTHPHSPWAPVRTVEVSPSFLCRELPFTYTFFLLELLFLNCE